MPSPSPSSSDLMAQQVINQLRRADVHSDSVRVVELNVSPGVEEDSGRGDEWPQLREKICAADIW